MQDDVLAVPVEILPRQAATFVGQLLADLAGVSLGLAVCLGLAGWLLWATGWCWHRFWLVFLSSAGAGLVGLLSGRALGAPVLIIGLLLAISAGLLAVELSRLIVFVAGGASVAMAARTFAPGLPDDLLVFLVGGLVSLLLFRLWVMLLASLLGAGVGGLATLTLLGKCVRGDWSAWADTHPQTVQIIFGVLVLLGVVTQALVERWWLTRQRPNARAGDDDQPDHHANSGSAHPPDQPHDRKR